MSERLAVGVLERLRSTPTVLRALLAGMPSELVEEPLDEGWSARDVVAHLTSTEPHVMGARIRAMVASPGGPVANVDEERVLEDSGLRALPVDEVLDRFEAGRRESLALIEGLSEEELGATGAHEVVGTITVAEMVNHFAFHDAVHIAQIARMLGAPADAARGGLSQFA